jgi:hypothetical protein
MRFLIRLLPKHRREFGRALLAEASSVPRGWRRIAWLAGGIWFVVKENAVRPAGYGLALLGAAAMLIWTDQLGTSDDAGQVSLFVLLATAGCFGLAAPRWAWLSALVLGSTLALAGIAFTVWHPAWGAPARPGRNRRRGNTFRARGADGGRGLPRRRGALAHPQRPLGLVPAAHPTQDGSQLFR